MRKHARSKCVFALTSCGLLHYVTKLWLTCLADYKIKFFPSGETNVKGYDSYSKTILPPKTTIYFSVALEHFAASKAVYLGFTFQKDNADDEHSNDYGAEQKLYLRETNLPK